MVTISLRRSRNCAYVRVYNLGPGFPDANGPDRAANFTNMLNRLRGPRLRHTAPSEGDKGHGLGLRVVARLAKELGTVVTLQSWPDFITVFRFKLPLVH